MKQILIDFLLNIIFTILQILLNILFIFIVLTSGLCGIIFMTSALFIEIISYMFYLLFCNKYQINNDTSDNKSDDTIDKLQNNTYNIFNEMDNVYSVEYPKIDSSLSENKSKNNKNKSEKNKSKSKSKKNKSKNNKSKNNKSKKNSSKKNKSKKKK
jgi:biopolymer transport protein ExbB/TolQ